MLFNIPSDKVRNTVIKKKCLFVAFVSMKINELLKSNILMYLIIVHTFHVFE